MDKLCNYDTVSTLSHVFSLSVLFLIPFGPHLSRYWYICNKKISSNVSAPLTYQSSSSMNKNTHQNLHIYSKCSIRYIHQTAAWKSLCPPYMNSRTFYPPWDFNANYEWESRVKFSRPPLYSKPSWALHYCRWTPFFIPRETANKGKGNNIMN